MKRFSLLPILLLFISVTAFSQVTTTLSLNDTLNVKATLIHSEDFDSDLSSWVKEIEPSDHSFVTIKDGKLDIDVGAGCSVWFTKKMEGGIIIEFDAIMVDEGGVNDNVQDLNTYWMSNDPEYPDNIFEQSEARGGIYKNYFPISLYYVGLGETQNRRSRLRRYDGLGNRPWLPEHDLTDSEDLLTGNQLYHIKIIAFDNIIQYYSNNKLLFELNDPTPFTSGYFCFRTVKNHMTLDNFRVYQLE
jgi:hypothetical protein